MDLNLIEVINQVGFPIAMVVYFAWDRTIIMKRFTDSNKKLAELISRLLEREKIENE